MQYTKIVLASERNQDVQGDLYEYMLGHMQFAGRGGAGGCRAYSRHRVAPARFARGLRAGVDGRVHAAGGGAV
jgi:hypothetical protein